MFSLHLYNQILEIEYYASYYRDKRAFIPPSIFDK